LLKNLEQYYELYDHGTSPDAPCVVFLPGVACSTWLFRDSVPLFNPNYKVVIFNNPGTNGTRLPVNLTVERIAQIVVKVLQKENLTNCILIGHSMGGFTAQQVYKICPELVSKLVLLSSSCGHPFTKEEALRLAKDLVPNALQRIRDFNSKPEEGVSYTFSNHFMETQPIKYKIFAHRLFEMRPRQSAVVRHFLCASRFSSFKFLKDIKCPTLIVHGEDDKLITPKGAHMLHENIEGSKLVMYPHCGHFPMVESGTFYDDVLKFIKESK
tara:strand:+ start:56963 stop:57769 length:807 start_codon:yes stop_codon:yes gene_type:complete